jgi:hypothetical protein
MPSDDDRTKAFAEADALFKEIDTHKLHCQCDKCLRFLELATDLDRPEILEQRIRTVHNNLLGDRNKICLSQLN